MNIDRLITNKDTSTVWSTSLGKELGHLSQGFKERIKAQDTIDLIAFHEIPSSRKITHTNFIYDHRPLILFH